jgi:predicted phosphatase
LDPLLNVINTVKSVRIKPESVSATIDKSEATDRIYSSLGRINILLAKRKMVNKEKIIPIE